MHVILPILINQFIILHMKLTLTNLRIADKNQPPFFILESSTQQFSPTSVIVKVLSFSIDPVMRVWLSGAKTNYRQVKQGDIFNCFGIGQVIQSTSQQYPIGSYVWGNTGTTSYFELTQQKQRECVLIDKDLVQLFGPTKFIYLINNGLAAYAGFELLKVEQGDNVVVSTAAGATGLLLCHLLRSKKANIIAIASENKHKYLQQFTKTILDYKDRKVLAQQLRKIKFRKYFDNVGESQLDLVLALIDNFGILALCGATEHYLSPKQGGIANYSVVVSKRLKMEGVNFSFYFPQAREIFELYRDANLHIKQIKMTEFIDYFNELFKSGGSIVGKIVVNPHFQ